MLRSQALYVLTLVGRSPSIMFCTDVRGGLSAISVEIMEVRASLAASRRTCCDVLTVGQKEVMQ